MDLLSLLVPWKWGGHRLCGGNKEGMRRHKDLFSMYIDMKKSVFLGNLWVTYRGVVYVHGISQRASKKHENLKQGPG